jgi:exopolysaccharide production protein ExoQ
MNPLLRLLSLWLLGLAVYLGGWYVEGPAFQAVQMGSVALFIGAGFLALLAGDTRRIELSNAEYIVGGAFCSPCWWPSRARTRCRSLTVPCS